MFLKYLKSGLKNIITHRVYMIISIIGMAVGFAASFFILLYVLNETDFDRCHKNRKRAYRVITYQKLFNFTSPGTPCILAQTMNDNIPEIEKISRLRRVRGSVKHNNEYIYEGNLFGADNDIFDIFTFNFIEKSGENLINDNYSMVISESDREKYFGDSLALGKELIVNLNGQDVSMTVTGV